MLLNDSELKSINTLIKNRQQYLGEKICDSISQNSNWLRYEEIIDCDDHKELLILNKIYKKINSIKSNNNKNSSDLEIVQG